MIIFNVTVTAEDSGKLVVVNGGSANTPFGLIEEFMEILKKVIMDVNSLKKYEEMESNDESAQQSLF